MKKRSCILVADDDKADQYLLERAFKEQNIGEEIRIVNNGEELMDFLCKQGPYKNIEVPFPKLILLDLNMPLKDGQTVLKEIKANPSLNKIPIIIYSTSNNSDDIAQSYKNGANSYIVKPNSYDDLLEIVEVLKRYWLITVAIV